MAALPTPWPQHAHRAQEHGVHAASGVPLPDARAQVMGSGVLGPLQHADASVLIPRWVFGGANIRFQEALAGEGCACATPHAAAAC